MFILVHVINVHEDRTFTRESATLINTNAIKEIRPQTVRETFIDTHAGFVSISTEVIDDVAEIFLNDGNRFYVEESFKKLVRMVEDD